MTSQGKKRAAAYCVASVIAGIVPAFGCRSDGGTTPGGAPSPSAPAATNRTRIAALAAIEAAELGRAAGSVPTTALVDRDVVVRRAAARAFARIGEEGVSKSLTKLLADEDGEVVAWSAYGLGLACEGHEPEVVRALVARAAALAPPVAQPGDPPKDTGHDFVLDPLDAIADALSRCNADDAEQTLRAWLEGPKARAESAARSLGRLAARRHRLDDASVVALLDAAARPDAVSGALSAFGVLDALSDASRKRLLGVARAALEGGGPRRAFAIRALGAAGAGGVDALVALVTDDRATVADRSAAATTLGRSGADARAALGAILAKLVPDGTALDEHWLASHYGPLSATLGALDAPPSVPASTDALTRLADAPLPAGAAPPVQRRLVRIRCAAAAVLAGTASQSTRLVHCDPDEHGRTGAIAVIRVLDRGALTGARLEVWRGFARAADPGVRRAALALLPRHPETKAITELVAALSAKEPGVVAQAARAIAEAPQLAAEHPAGAALARASFPPAAGGAPPEIPNTNAPSGADGSEPPSRAIVDALARALDTERPPDQIETRVSLARAAAALGALSLKARVERYCKSTNATLRRSAELALRRLGGTSATCVAPKGLPVESPPEQAARHDPVTLTFVTDAGRLGITLSPHLAPFAVQRLVELARAGLYDHVAIHRVSPGFVVQFGDPVGDGSGGSGRPPIPTESSPVEFGALSAGLALGGRDTGSSQIFVTLSPEPHLYGEYPLLGWADAEWGAAAEGDIVERVEVRE